MKGENSMQVYLLRHGIAEEESSRVNDADRALTNEGRRKLRHVLAHVADSGVKASLILTSPLKRAVESAAIARSCLKSQDEPVVSRSLVPGGNVADVWTEMRTHHEAEVLVLVGHNPLFANLAPYLLGTPELRVDFKKGAMMCIDFESIGLKPKGVLRWYLTARLAGNCE